MSFETTNFNNKGSPDGDREMPGASDSLHVPVREVQDSKIWVLVEGGRDFDPVRRGWIDNSGDTAGRFVTQFCQADLENTEEISEKLWWLRRSGMTSQFKKVKVHDSTKNWMVRLNVPISYSTGPFHDSHVLRHIAANRRSKFIGPAYPNKKYPDSINDTQLCVSGKVEEHDESLEAAAIREIGEEIGRDFEIRDIRQMAGPVEANGFINYLFFAKI